MSNRAAKAGGKACLQASGLMNSINWPAPSLWVFIAQLVGHCSANAEATGSLPVEAPKNFFQATSQLLKLRFNCDGHIHFICIPAVHIISFCAWALVGTLACSFRLTRVASASVEERVFRFLAARRLGQEDKNMRRGGGRVKGVFFRLLGSACKRFLLPSLLPFSQFFLSLSVLCIKPLLCRLAPGVQMVGKDAKNGATAQRTARKKRHGKNGLGTGYLYSCQCLGC